MTLVAAAFDPVRRSPCKSCKAGRGGKEVCALDCPERIAYLKALGLWREPVAVREEEGTARRAPTENKVEWCEHCGERPKKGYKYCWECAAEIRRRAALSGPFPFICKVCEKPGLGLNRKQIVHSGVCQRIWNARKAKKRRDREQAGKPTFRQAIRLAAKYNRLVTKVEALEVWRLEGP